MEIVSQNLPQVQHIQSLFKNLNKGDQVAARVVRRVAPFKYVIHFRGQNFQVNSAIHFNPNDFALIELIETNPRMKFKFIGNLSADSIAKSSSEMIKMLGFGDSELARDFSVFAIKFNFPLKKIMLRQFLSFKDVIDQNISHRELLLPFFWIKQFADRHQLPEWQIFLDTLFNNSEKKADREKSRKGSAGEECRDNESDDMFSLKLESLFSRQTGFKNLLQNLVGSLNMPPEGESFKENNRTKSLLKFYLAAIQDFSENSWVGIPSKSLIFEKNVLSFWRRCPQNPEQLDFCFQASKERMGSIAASGSILRNQINLRLTFEHPDLVDIAENQKTILLSMIEKIGFTAGKIHFDFSKDVNGIIGTMLFVENETKIEVKI